MLGLAALQRVCAEDGLRQTKTARGDFLGELDRRVQVAGQVVCACLPAGHLRPWCCFASKSRVLRAGLTPA